MPALSRQADPTWMPLLQNTAAAITLCGGPPLPSPCRGYPWVAGFKTGEPREIITVMEARLLAEQSLLGSCARRLCLEQLSAATNALVDLRGTVMARRRSKASPPSPFSPVTLQMELDAKGDAVRAVPLYSFDFKALNLSTTCAPAAGAFPCTTPEGEARVDSLFTALGSRFTPQGQLASAQRHTRVPGTPN